jgi:hypothetical protein
MLDNINSGADYAQIVIDTIIEGEKQIPEHAQMPIALLEYLTEEIQTQADIHYNEYIIGKRDTFMFSDVELEEMYNKAGERYVGEMLDGLVEKGMITMHIGEDGEFLYGLSEQGRQAAELDGIKKHGRKPKKK